MLVFVVPLVSKLVSKNFESTSACLKRTLKSICNQTSGSFEIIVVCHELPQMQFFHKKVHYVAVDFDLSLCIAEKEKTSNNPGLDIVMERLLDKGRKILFGYYEAQRFNPTHIMFVDADDLVSNRLAELCENNPSHYGWYVEKGYRYQENSRCIYLKRRNLHKECGTAFIFRNDLIPAPNPDYNRGFDYYRFFVNHAYVVDKMKKAGYPLSPLPFYGIIYMLHGSNLHATREYEEAKRTLVRVLKNIINMRPLSQKIVREFNLT